MFSRCFRTLSYGLIAVAALTVPPIHAQTTATCNGLAATIVATAPGDVFGTQGDDVIVGTSGNDRIYGLGGNDTICALGGNDQISGGIGADVVFGQAGDDTFLWSPGDGSDRIEGSTGIDTLQFSGANVNESFDISPNGTRIRFVRNIASISLDIGDVERINLEARGGSDLIVVSSLKGTPVQQLSIDLEGVDNSNTPDGQPDSIIVFGSTLDDQITIAGSGNALSLTGAGPKIQILNSEGALDYLSVYGVDGNDRITAQNLAAGLVKLVIEGNIGNDTLTGSLGADALIGGEGNDTLIWSPGTPADLLSGEAGNDTLQVLGSSAAENLWISAGVLEAQIYNNADAVTVNSDAETVELQLRTGPDQVTVYTAAGAMLQNVKIDLRPSQIVTTGDGQSDAIFVNGTNAIDNVNVTGAAGSVTVSGLGQTITVQGSEYVRDTLTINGGYEADILNAETLAANTIRLVLRGGLSNDTLTGSLGDDVFAWFPGDGSDIIQGRTGNDTLSVTGANIGENISISADQQRLRFTRDIGSIVLLASELERVTFAAVGGADNISLGDLSSTTVKQVALDFASSTSTAGDGQPDTISIAALTSSSIGTTTGPGTLNITWAGVRISATGVEPAIDRLSIQTSAAAPLTLMSAVDREEIARAAGVDQ